MLRGLSLGRIARMRLPGPGTWKSPLRRELPPCGIRRDQAISPSGPHRSSSNFREASVPSLMVRCGKIFIKSLDVTFGKTPDRCTDGSAFTWHTDPVRSLSHSWGRDAPVR